MQNNEIPVDEPQRPQSWLERIEKAKVTPVTFIAFFALLAAMCGAAMLVGYTVHRLAHAPASAAKP